MSSSSSSGIQTLLEAEHKAQEIVQEARSFRTQRLKASKSDAVAEIDKYKKKREEEFKSSTQEEEQDDTKAEEAAADKSKGDIEAMNKKVADKKQTVISYMLDATIKA